MVIAFVILEGHCDLSRRFGHCYFPYANTDRVFAVGAVNPSQGRPGQVKRMPGNPRRYRSVGICLFTPFRWLCKNSIVVAFPEIAESVTIRLCNMIHLVTVYDVRIEKG